MKKERKAMQDKSVNREFLSEPTLSTVLQRYEYQLQHHDLVIELADGNVTIKQKKESDYYEVHCHESDLTISSTLQTFLEKQ